MLMRLAFAAAIHVDPDVLIVDEALSVGDVYFQRKSLDRMELFPEGGEDGSLCLARSGPGSAVL
jgi:ABC-type polysaccharide/polyol phosphate transport system ATPase subunit